MSLWIELNGYSCFCCHIASQLCLFLLLLLLLWYANLFRWSNTVLHSASAIRDSISENSLVWSIDDKHQCFVFLVYSFSLLLLLLRDLPMLPMALTLTANGKKRQRKKMKISLRRFNIIRTQVLRNILFDFDKFSIIGYWLPQIDATNWFAYGFIFKSSMLWKMQQKEINALQSVVGLFTGITSIFSASEILI